MEYKLKDFSEEKPCYANCMLLKCKCPMGMNGSSISESNHSSVETHLNDRDTFSNQNCKSPLSVAKDSMLRETKNANEWNQLLCNQKS